jgi:hypothetical protein
LALFFYQNRLVAREKWLKGGEERKEISPSDGGASKSSESAGKGIHKTHFLGAPRRPVGTPLDLNYLGAYPLSDFCWTLHSLPSHAKSFCGMVKVEFRTLSRFRPTSAPDDFCLSLSAASKSGQDPFGITFIGDTNTCRFNYRTVTKHQPQHCSSSRITVWAQRTAHGINHVKYLLTPHWEM